MKKSILAIAAGLSLLVSNPSYAKDRDFSRVVESLKNCAYSSYKNQSNPSQENASKEQSNCSKFEDLKREKGIDSLEDYFEKNGWFYANSKEITDGKEINSHYAAPIVKKFEKEGFPVYFTRLGKGVDSFDGFTKDMKYLRTVNYPDGSKRIVIDLERIEKDALIVKKDWKNYLPNHRALLSENLADCNPVFEPVYFSLKKYQDVRKGYLNERLNSFIVHELTHAKQNHAYDSILGEKIARSAEINNSPVAIYDIQMNASKGKEAETSVLQCIMGTKDISNKQEQAKFYLKGKKYIQQRADYCKRQFMKQR